MAIEFEEQIKKYLWDIQQVLKENSIKGNFTNKDNFHLTLKFIGNVQINALETLKKSIDKVTKNGKSFALLFEKIGRFQREQKSIVWVGLKKNKILEALHDQLENILVKEGYPKEQRKFRPHITLGREVLFQSDFEKLQKIIEIKSQEIWVNKISLMESTRINGKLEYIPIYIKYFER
ncbi:RNA 2',3'-cyclic phosphodiesterase [Crassaminicella thermophila]|uniref:RNA 2',3'-cyclic phosphodiesterase n=1 Tax=Crassaminicella thermophila TaxID=2599308 RepID=UPI0022B99EF3|nr:RNA 2',3'-cyclic phosphodiesterase [Crassaminicella thermophila]